MTGKPAGARPNRTSNIVLLFLIGVIIGMSGELIYSVIHQGHW